MKLFFQILGATVWLLISLSCSRPVMEKEAKKLAQESFAKTCIGFHYNPASFTGPMPTTVGNTAFAYEWRDTSPNSDFGILVTVDRTGGTNVSFLGHIPGVKYPGEG